MKTLKSFLYIMTACTLLSCHDGKFGDQVPFPGQNEDSGNEGDNTEQVVSSRDEQYRPQIHFTPNANWMNDPNGMVYVDGTWHLYYQYNPRGNDWGNMSWGHATSTDLMHWTEQPVAMTRNEWGDIFSGSAVVDKNNVAGFGAGAILAFYTGTEPAQQQCLAYSTDGGKTFTQYAGNPVIPNQGIGDFRDPKVFYHEASGKWVMCLALGWEHRIEFWGSSNLKDWEKLSDFTIDNARVNQGQFECPDLVRLPYNGGEKWVLIVSNNPGGVAGGSATEYFIGNFDGRTFTPDNLEYPLWLDYGADNYAGVTWSNAPDNRVVMIGWMNNWNYCGNVPCSPWRSAMTLPRELKLVDVNGEPRLATTIVRELDGIAGEWKDAPNGVCTGGDAYEMKFNVNLKEHSSFTVGNAAGQYMEVEINPSAGRIIAKRTGTTGDVSFHNLFAVPSTSAPFDKNLDSTILHVYVDHSSVEIISEDGTVALTNLVFPTVPYDRISGIDGVEYRALKSIW